MRNNRWMHCLIWLVAFAMGSPVLPAGGAGHGGGHARGGHGGGSGGPHVVPAPNHSPVTNTVRGYGPFSGSRGLTPITPQFPVSAPGSAQPTSRISAGPAPGVGGARAVTPPAFSPAGITRAPVSATPGGYPGAGLARGTSDRPLAFSPAVSGYGNFNAGNFNAVRPLNTGGWASAMHGGWSNAYAGYHSRWVRGYWPRSTFAGANAAWAGPSGGFGWGFGSGSGLGYGLSSWNFGPALTNWGYSSYSNPYYNGASGAGSTLVAGQPAGYDYFQPINSMSQPAPESAAADAVAIFDQERNAFKAEDYAQSLSCS